jgi:hypothetical protein
MENAVTYECKKCGKRFAVSEKGKKHLVPVYCCGEEAVKSREKKPAARKNKGNSFPCFQKYSRPSKKPAARERNDKNEAVQRRASVNNLICCITL